MGKGFNNYMTKKFFHPSSKDNIKRVWMAKQKTDYEKKKQEDLMTQYQREQEMLSNRALLGDEKAKMGLSFLYDAPPGMKNKEKEDDEPEFKFEWQRKYNAPREAYAKGDDTISDQPFGIEVRNIRCIKCRQWGHVNTDKICPLFGSNLTAEPPQPETSTSSLLEGLKEDGFRLKESMLERFMASQSGEPVLAGGDEDDPEVQFLKSLTPKQKKKLLKKLNGLKEKNGAGKHSKGKKDKKKKKSKKKRSHDSSDSDSSDGAQKQRHKKAVKRRDDSSDNSSDEERYKAQGARPKKIKREADTDHSDKKRHHEDGVSGTGRHSRRDSSDNPTYHSHTIKREKRSRSPRPQNDKQREKRSKSPRPHSNKPQRGRSSDSDSDDLPSKTHHRNGDRRERHSKPESRRSHSPTRKSRSRSPAGRRDRQSRSPVSRRNRDRSSSRDRHRDTQGGRHSRKDRSH